MRKFTFLLTAALFCGSLATFAQDDITVTPSLVNGKPTFTFDEDKSYFGIQMGEETLKKYAANADYVHIGAREEEGRHLWIWSRVGAPTDYTFKFNTPTDGNAFGVPGEYLSATVLNVGWSGLGYTNDADAPINLSEITEEYTFHMAVKMTTKDNVTIGINDGKYKVGTTNKSTKKATLVLGTTPKRPAKNTVYAQFTRDGQWYNIDIPMEYLTDACGLTFKNVTSFVGNLFTIDAGAKAGTTVDYDAVCFYGPKRPTAGVKDAKLAEEANAPVRIYTVDGKCVSEAYAKANKGLYIIKQGDKTKKVVM